MAPSAVLVTGATGVVGRAREVVARARGAGLRRIVVLSSGAVTYGMDNEFQRPVEIPVEEAGLEWTHVRPGKFAYNKVALWGPSIRAQRTVHYPDPERLQTSPVHELDVAALATHALHHPASRRTTR